MGKTIILPTKKRQKIIKTSKPENHHFRQSQTDPNLTANGYIESTGILIYIITNHVLMHFPIR